MRRSAAARDERLMLSGSVGPDLVQRMDLLAQQGILRRRHETLSSAEALVAILHRRSIHIIRRFLYDVQMSSSLLLSKAFFGFQN